MAPDEKFKIAEDSVDQLPILRPERSTFHHTDSKEPDSAGRTDDLSCLVPQAHRPHTEQGAPRTQRGFSHDTAHNCPSWYGAMPNWSSGLTRPVAVTRQGSRDFQGAQAR